MTDAVQTQSSPGEFKQRVFSGIQPSGDLHVGNYFGAIQQHLANQVAGDSYYFIASFIGDHLAHAAKALR